MIRSYIFLVFGILVLASCEPREKKDSDEIVERLEEVRKDLDDEIEKLTKEATEAKD